MSSFDPEASTAAQDDNKENGDLENSSSQDMDGDVIELAESLKSEGNMHLKSGQIVQAIESYSQVLYSPLLCTLVCDKIYKPSYRLLN